MRARELGIHTGTGVPGPLNGITDVAGVRAGHAALIDEGTCCTVPAAIEPDESIVCVVHAASAFS
jgi:D-aminopeptidase